MSSHERHVVVVGAVNVDLVVQAPRLPGPGETVVGPEVVRHGGGKGANSAVAAARAGAAVQLVGAVGRDDVGVSAADELRSEGVGLEALVTVADHATGMALIVVDPAAENQIAVGAGANSALTASHVEHALATVLPGAGCVLVSTEIPDDAIATAVLATTDAGVTCVLNPAPVRPAVAGVAASGAVLTPNAGELADLAAEWGIEAGGGTEQVALAVARRAGAPVVVTLGGDGCRLVTPDGTSEHRPVVPATAVDTTGAGDTFNGVLAARLAAGDDLAEAVEWARWASSLSVRQLGARGGMPTWDELRTARGAGT
jgi:ribokinase